MLPLPLPLSIAIVCRNSEATIGRTLQSVAGLAAEIIAVDSGSTDGTIELLERHRARIIRTQWRGYVATKQMALDACTQQWVLALDSDESLQLDLRHAVHQAISAGPPDIAGFYINRQVWYRGRPLKYAWQPEWRLRLVRREAAYWTGLDPHDHLAIRKESTATRTEHLSGNLRHDSIGTFADFFAKQAGHARLMAQSMRADGKRAKLGKLVTSPVGAFAKQLLLKQSWRDGWPGWLAASSTAAGALMKHAILLELTRSAEAPDARSPAGPVQPTVRPPAPAPPAPAPR
jgi:glycosyltransferase involved in cell wall biosynthesis